jgi:hypothetical protein
MFSLNLHVKNPFVSQNRYMRQLWYCGHKLTSNKHFELEISWAKWTPLLEVEILTAFTGIDHAGPSCSLTILGLEIRASIYDYREWDHENNCWLPLGKTNAN